MPKLIRGGRILDPASNRDGTFDLLIENAKISQVEPKLSSLPPKTEVIEAQGLLVVPGLIDIHTHLREPGYEYKETILSGSRAAAAGGFTGIACIKPRLARRPFGISKVGTSTVRPSTPSRSDTRLTAGTA